MSIAYSIAFVTGYNLASNLAERQPSEDPVVKELLLETGDNYLLEDNCLLLLERAT